MLPTSPTWMGGPTGLRGLAPGYNLAGYKSRVPQQDPEAVAAKRAKDEATIQDNNRAATEYNLQSGALGKPTDPQNIWARINLNRKPIGMPAPQSPPQNSTHPSYGMGGGRGYAPPMRPRAPIHGLSRKASGIPTDFGGLAEYDQLQERGPDGERSTRAFSDGSMDTGAPSAAEEVERRRRMGLAPAARAPVVSAAWARKHGTPKDDGSQRLWERPGQPLLVNDGHAPEFIKMPWGTMMPIEGPQQVITPQVPVQIIPARAEGSPVLPPNWREEAAKAELRRKITEQEKDANIAAAPRFLQGPAQWARRLTDGAVNWWNSAATPDYSAVETALERKRMLETQPEYPNLTHEQEMALDGSTMTPDQMPSGSVGVPGMLARPAPADMGGVFSRNSLPNDWLRSIAQPPAALPRDMALPRAPAPVIEPTTALALGAPVDSREAQAWANNLRAAATGNPALEARAQQATAWAAMTPAARAQVIQREQRQQRYAAAGDAVREQAQDPGLWAQLDHFNKTGQLVQPLTTELNGIRHLNIDPRHGTGSSRMLSPEDYNAAPPGVFHEAGLLNPDGSPKVDSNGVPLRDYPMAELSPGFKRRAWSMPVPRPPQLPQQTAYASPAVMASPQVATPVTESPYLGDPTALPPSRHPTAPVGEYFDPPAETARNGWDATPEDLIPYPPKTRMTSVTALASGMPGIRYSLPPIPPSGIASTSYVPKLASIWDGARLSNKRGKSADLSALRTLIANLGAAK